MAAARGQRATPAAAEAAAEAKATKAPRPGWPPDALKAGAALRLVLAQPAISSQLIDNLNASIHLRALLTDIFLLDESLKITGS